MSSVTVILTDVPTQPLYQNPRNKLIWKNCTTGLQLDLLVSETQTLSCGLHPIRVGLHWERKRGGNRRRRLKLLIQRTFDFSTCPILWYTTGPDKSCAAPTSILTVSPPKAGTIKTLILCFLLLIITQSKLILVVVLPVGYQVARAGITIHRINSFMWW